MLREGIGNRSRDVRASTSALMDEPQAEVNSAERIYREQYCILASQHQSDLMARFVFSVAMLLALWPVAEGHWATIWFLAMVCTGLFNSFAHPGKTLFPRRLSASTKRFDSATARLGSAITGVLWGGIIALFPSSDILQSGFLISLMLGYLVFGAAMRAVRLPILYCFVAGAMLASTLALALRDTAQFEQHLLLVLMAGFGLIALGHLCNQLLTQQIRLRLDSDKRADQYAAERDQARTEMLEKNQFLAAASHDLRQPVYAIGLFAGLLEIQLKQQDTNGVLGKIQHSIHALSSLFDGILDISRLDANAMEQDPQHVALDPLLSRLQSEYELLAVAKGLSLRVDTCGGHIAHVDPTLLQRVLMNLVSNAIKFTQQGSIVVSIESLGDTLSVTITDTGCGIASDQIEHVFVEYQQIRSEHCDEDTGRGLGLAIVRRLCKLMDIQISVSSTPGVGTEFSLLLAKGDLDKSVQKEQLYCEGALEPHSPPVLTPAQHASSLMAEVA